MSNEFIGNMREMNDVSGHDSVNNLLKWCYNGLLWLTGNHDGGNGRQSVGRVAISASGKLLFYNLSKKKISLAFFWFQMCW